jgi:hypothetical protein
MIGWKVQAKVMILNKQVEEQGKSLFLGPCRGVVRKALSAIQF